MPRIEPLSADVAPSDVRATYDRFLAERGNIPNMFRTLAYRPEVMKASEAFITAVMATGSLPRVMKELVSVRVSMLNATDYCRASHTALSRKFGADDATLAATVARPLVAAPDALDARTLAALAYADAVVAGSRHMSEASHAAVREHFDDGEIVELTAVIAAFMYFNTFNNALEVEITK